MTNHLYYVTYSDDCIHIVGPFDTHEKMLEDARAWQKVMDDDPRWFSIASPLIKRVSLTGDYLHVANYDLRDFLEAEILGEEFDDKKVLGFVEFTQGAFDLDTKNEQVAFEVLDKREAALADAWDWSGEGDRKLNRYGVRDALRDFWRV